MSLLDDFMVRSILAGVGVAIAAAPLGSFVVWRRMVYFGDATSPASILGVALSLALELSVSLGVVTVALVMAIAVTLLSRREYAMEILLGVLSYSALAFGLVAVSFISGVRIDLMAYLFGDILAVSRADLAVIWLGALAVIGLIAYRWKALLMSTLSEELAHANKIDPKREQLILTLTLAITVALAIKVVGALLIAAMLIIPAAAARPISRTPEMMAVIAAAIGSGSAVVGLWLAYLIDTPAGPSIVCVSALSFAATNLLSLANKQ